MTETPSPAEMTIRLAPEMPPEITAKDEAGIVRSWFSRFEDLVDVFRAQHKPVLRFLPEHLLATDLESCSAWVRPAGPASLLLATPSETKLLNAPLPPLVLVTHQSASLAVMALPDHTRPGRDTPLYHAPLPNINEHGAVCLGSTELGRFDPLSEETPWTAFWGSAFSSHQVAGKSRCYPDDVRLLLLELNGQPTFPLEDLVPTGLTLYTWLSGHARWGGML